LISKTSPAGDGGGSGGGACQEKSNWVPTMRKKNRKWGFTQVGVGPGRGNH